MGNRAVITWSKAEDVSKTEELGIYLHWNGGMDSVKPFLKYCELKGYASPDQDAAYGMSRICQVIGNYFGGTKSLGVNQCRYLDCDNWDNGTYICEGWNVVGRQFFRGPEQSGYDLEDMLLSINLAMPETERLPEGLIKSVVLGGVPTKELQLGELVYVKDHNGNYEKHKVIGYGSDEMVNGHDVSGIPYVDKYDNGSENINNYILSEYVYAAE